MNENISNRLKCLTLTHFLKMVQEQDTFNLKFNKVNCRRFNVIILTFKHVLLSSVKYGLLKNINIKLART